MTNRIEEGKQNVETKNNHPRWKMIGSDVDSSSLDYLWEWNSSSYNDAMMQEPKCSEAVLVANSYETKQATVSRDG